MKMFKLRTPHISKEGRVLSWASMIHGLGIGMLLPIFPTYVATIIENDSLIGFFYSAMALAMVLAGILSVYLYRRYTRLAVANVFLFVSAVASMYLVFTTDIYSVFVLGFIKVFASLFVVMSLGLMVHDFTKSKDIGKTEGVYFLFNNVGWFIGPLLGGIIGRYFGYEPVFALAGLFSLATIAFLSHKKLVEEHPALNVPKYNKHKVHPFSRFKGFFSNRERTGSYFVAIAFMMWTSFKPLIIPLFVVKMGFASDMSGLLMALSIIPFLLFEIPVGEYADKYNVRKPIIAGFLILGFMLLGVFASPWFVLDALFLILANVGAAFIEPLHDIYFFKNVSKKEENDYFGIFSTADPIAQLIGPAILSLSFLFLPFEYVFLFFGVFFLIVGGLTTKIQD